MADFFGLRAIISSLLRRTNYPEGPQLLDVVPTGRPPRVSLHSRTWAEPDL